MPADEQDPKSAPPPTGDEGAPLKFEEAPPPDPAPLTPRGRRRRGWRRVVNRRTAMWTALVAVTAVLALAFIIFLLYRTGQVDKFVARQIIDTLAKYNIRAEVGSFTSKLGPRTVEIRDLKLYNASTGALSSGGGVFFGSCSSEGIAQFGKRRRGEWRGESAEVGV